MSPSAFLFSFSVSGDPLPLTSPFPYYRAPTLFIYLGKGIGGVCCFLEEEWRQIYYTYCSWFFIYIYLLAFSVLTATYMSSNFLVSLYASKGGLDTLLRGVVSPKELQYLLQQVPQQVLQQLVQPLARSCCLASVAGGPRTPNDWQGCGVH